MLSWKDVLGQQARYTDLLREAEHERFVQQVLAGRERSARLHYQMLTRLGHRLAVWGCYLQECYGAMVVPPELETANLTRCTSEHRAI